MPIEKRTRVEIFLPLRSDIPAYNTALQWMAEEFAYERGGATLTVPFAGLFVSSARLDVVEDAVRVLYCDFDLDASHEEDFAGLTVFLESAKRFLLETLEEEEIWIIFFRSRALFHEALIEPACLPQPRLGDQNDTDYRIAEARNQN